MSDRLLAGLELYVLLAIARLEGAAYGAAIRSEIETRTGRSVAVGALYATLSRLEDKGLIVAEVETETGRVGRPRKSCSLTSLGQASLQQAMNMLSRMTDGLPLQALEETSP